MNNPENLAIDIEEQRKWLVEHKLTSGHSWSELQRRTGTSSALSQFGGNTYPGDNQKVAEAIYRYRQHIAAQAQIAVEAPTLPGYFETPTSRRIQALLGWAQRGRIVLIATCPGASKTQALENYAASVPNVWTATMAPSTAGVNNMQIEVLAALGEGEARGTPQALTRRIRERVRNSGGLIAIDEAQHLSEKALEEIRGWHDMTGIGIALVGNQDVLKRLEIGSRKDAFARLASRVSQRLILDRPLDGDADALSDAWKIIDTPMRDFVRALAKRPGGLRTCTMVAEFASMLASGERMSLSLNHLQDAWSALSTRQLAA